MNRMPLLFACVLSAALFGGCATLLGANPEKQATAVMNAWQEAMTTGDVDALLALYSEDFTNSRVGDKAGLVRMLNEIAPQGYFQNVTSSLETMRIESSPEGATITGVTIKGSQGQVNMSFTLAKREGGWKIIASEASEN